MGMITKSIFFRKVSHIVLHFRTKTYATGLLSTCKVWDRNYSRQCGTFTQEPNVFYIDVHRPMSYRQKICLSRTWRWLSRDVHEGGVANCKVRGFLLSEAFLDLSSAIESTWADLYAGKNLDRFEILSLEIEWVKLGNLELSLHTFH